MDDEIQLIEDSSPVEINFPEKCDETDEKPPRINKENHEQSVGSRRRRVGRRLIDLKRRLTGDPLTVKRGKQVTWLVTVFVLGLTALLLLAVPLLVDTSLEHEKCRDFEDLSFGEEYEEFPYIFSEGTFEMCRRGETVLKGRLGTNHSYISEVKVDVYAYSNNTLLNATRLSDSCLRIEWVGMSSRQYPLSDCFDLGQDVLWFGAYEVGSQNWTINNASFPRTSFVPRDYLSPLETQPDVFGPILHPLWISSNGIGIHVDPQVQLYVIMNNSQICLQALPFELECAPGAANETFFNYTVCVFNSAAQTARHFLSDSGLIPHAHQQPNSKVFSDPVWSTSSLDSINDNSLQSLIDGVTNNNFNFSMVRLEEGYSANDGDLLFQSDGITSGKLEQLSQQVDISVWVHPFVNYSAAHFEQDIGRDFYLPSLSEIEGNSVSLVKWWRGYGAVVNFLNDSVREEQAQRFESFVQTNHLTSLTFDGGEYTYLPKCVYTENLVHPADYVRAYVRMVGNASYSAASSVRVGYFTQDQPIFVRLLDRTFTWSENNGLRSVLNAVISLGLGGYSFVIPNKIGGNVSEIKNSGDRELFIRWVQLNAFLPVMEFGYLPWTPRDQMILSVVKNMSTLHVKLVSGEPFQQALSSATTKGYPIVRPLWWLANGDAVSDKNLYTITDQFLIGDEIMAAPILHPNTDTREVYFPQGTAWEVEMPLHSVGVCQSTSENKPCANGQKQSFYVPLNTTLYFKRVN